MNAPIISISFDLDGRAVEAMPGETILQAARRHGVDIPHLCYTDGMRPDGNCRACMVEVDGERTLAASCCRMPRAGMQVKAQSPRALHSQKMVLELLMSDQPAHARKTDSELHQWAKRMGLGTARFAARTQVAADHSHPAIAVDLDACIQCTRCVRACREEQVNDVIGLAFRGEQAKIVFDMDDPMGVSTCVACGECVQACPTGALRPATLTIPETTALRPVDSVCPYCGVGCQLTYHVEDRTDGQSRIVHVTGRDGPANHGRLCVKGRYGFDYAQNPQRLTKPLMRRAGVPKDPYDIERAAAGELDLAAMFEEVSWEKALDFAGAELVRLRSVGRGPASALAGFGSAKGSNEEAYLFQKLVRTGFGTNNVDHCTRLCHASSVAALLEGVGSGSVSNPVADAAQAEVVFIIGANPAVNHPVAATWIKNAAKSGVTLILADPRRSDLTRHATHALQFRSGTDVALLNAFMHVIIAENLVDQKFVAERTSGFEAIKASVAECTPERMSEICGIDAETLRIVARRYATSRASMIFWGMGISQHVHGTDNARCLIALAMITGQIGRPGTGLHPLRGQNNVQGASDAGLIPMSLPDYQMVNNQKAHDAFELLWGMPLEIQPGLTVVEILRGAADGRIRGLYVAGENPAMSDPDLHHARAALANLEHLIVQDIFMTETSILADVILPATAHAEKWGTYTNTDRLVQLGRPALPTPGQAKPDLWITREIARRVGLDWPYEAKARAAGVSKERFEEHVTSLVYEEMRTAMPSIHGISWKRLQRDLSATYPCDNEDEPGQSVVFVEDFPTDSGRAKLVAATFEPAAELPDAEFPFTLITGRQLEHWHTGTMTRHTLVLDAIEPAPTVMMHPSDLAKLDLPPGGIVTVESRRGAIRLPVRATEEVSRGTVFIPFAYVEAAANSLTIAALDPVAKIPEFKLCAVRVTKG